MALSRLHLKLRAAWRASNLDDALAGGADPLASDELTHHSLKLADPAHRAGLAKALELLVSHVSAGGAMPVPSPTILRREPIRQSRAELLVLAWRLRAEGFHCLRGLAMADRMIRYGDSPLYMAPSPQKLRRRVEEILAALEPEDQATAPPG